MRFAVESWDPEFASPLEAMTGDAPAASVDLAVELPASQWTVRTPPRAEPVAVLFIDGVRRIDARVWIEDGAVSRLGICASIAAGGVLCNHSAHLVAAQVERCLFTPSPSSQIATRHGDYGPRAVSGDDPVLLINELRESLRSLEFRVAQAAGTAGLVVVDGPLTRHDQLIGAVGYVKTHRVEYLPPELSPVVACLQPGQRTPLFVTQTHWSRYSWYLRLPGGAGHPWAGVARCELPSRLTLEEAIRRADRVTSLLPRFASAAHKEPRAPQNLYPIAGLERQLRRRLGEAQLMYRAICQASSSAELRRLPSRL